MDYFSVLTGFLGGFALFIFGMNLMGEGLQKSAGTRMKKLLGMLTRNKLMGVLLGTLITGIIQSSSATTVMVVGFVNAGIISLNQSIGVIMGANIGTTVTAWLVSTLEWSGGALTMFSPQALAPFAAAIGAMMVLLAKNRKFSQTGEIIVGLGMLFMGMTAMSTAMKPLSGSPFFGSLFVTLGSNPLLGILAGTLVTAVIQSSSASVGILQSLAMAGIIPWSAAVYIILGQNIGTCVTALLSSIGASRNARAASYIHLLFNIIGSVVFGAMAVLYFTFANSALGGAFITSTQISMVHTVFNLANTAMLFPFSNQIIRLSERLANIGKTQEDESEAVHLDDRVLGTPAFAIECALKETSRLANLAAENLDTAVHSLFDGDTAKVDKVYKREKNIDALEKAITAYLVKITNTGLNERENALITSLFHTVHDIERVGDHSENIAELTELLLKSEASFSEFALKELDEISSLTSNCLKNSITALENDDKSLAHTVASQEEAIDAMEKSFRAGHIKRLSNNECNITSGVIFLDVLTNLERISDHALNIAEFVLKEKLPKKSKELSAVNPLAGN